MSSRLKWKEEKKSKNVDSDTEWQQGWTAARRHCFSTTDRWGENNAAHSDHTLGGVEEEANISAMPLQCNLWRSKVSNELKQWDGRVATSTMCLNDHSVNHVEGESIVSVGAHCIYFILCKCVCVGRPGHWECTWAADHWHFLRCHLCSLWTEFV